jgi:hypothetical protein
VERAGKCCRESDRRRRRARRTPRNVNKAPAEGGTRAGTRRERRASGSIPEWAEIVANFGGECGSGRHAA